MVRPVGADQVTMSAQVRPMLAQPVRALPEGRSWAYEFKWDGIRALARIAGGELSLIGRNGTNLTSRFPELHPLASQRPDESMILDGEIVVMRGEIVDFGLIQPRIHLTDPHRIASAALRHPATYMIFDMLGDREPTMMRLPLRERRARLEALELAGSHWGVPPIVAGNGDAAATMLALAGAHQLEGVIAKRWDSPYEPGNRSGAWVKYRIVHAQEFVVGGWRPSQSGPRDIGALALGYHPAVSDSNLIFAGFVGTGFSQRDHRQLFELLVAREQEENPFGEPLPRDDVRFVRPELVVEVRFAQWTGQGILRHASYRGLRNDKPAEQVVRET